MPVALDYFNFSLTFILKLICHLPFAYLVCFTETFILKYRFLHQTAQMANACSLYTHSHTQREAEEGVPAVRAAAWYEMFVCLYLMFCLLFCCLIYVGACWDTCTLVDV